MYTLSYHDYDDDHDDGDNGDADADDADDEMTVWFVIVIAGISQFRSWISLRASLVLHSGSVEEGT